MRRYTIEVNGRPFVVDVQEQDGDAYAVEVDGQSFQVQVAGDEDGVDSDAPRIRPATVAAARPGVAVAALPARTAPASSPAAAGNSSALKAPMPGVMLRVLVAGGARVRRGQDLAVLEAMKMENIIRAPADGTVLEVCVQPGQQLTHGEVILHYEQVSPEEGA